MHREPLGAFGNKKRNFSHESSNPPPLTVRTFLIWFRSRVLTNLRMQNYSRFPENLRLLSSVFVLTAKKAARCVYLLPQIVTDSPRCGEVISYVETAQRLLRQRGASHDNKLNWKTEDWSQSSYLDKLDIEKKAIHLLCPGVFFPVNQQKHREAIPDSD